MQIAVSVALALAVVLAGLGYVLGNWMGHRRATKALMAEIGRLKGELQAAREAATRPAP